MSKNTIIRRKDTSYIVVITDRRQGVIVVDTQDIDKLSAHNWYINSRGYAARGQAGKTILMHRQLLGYPECVDHTNGNQLDNRRSNLRPATHAQNMGNRRMNKNNKTGFRGVQNFRDRYRVFMGTKYLGVFVDKKSAARAYDKAASEYFGEFASLNFP